MQIIAHGTGERVTGQNSANSESSRSYAILQINIREREASNICGIHINNKICKVKCPSQIQQLVREELMFKILINKLEWMVQK